MILSFLAALGGALLASTALDSWIGKNYQTRAQSLYLAEAGIEEAREKLRVSGVPADAAAPFIVSEGRQVWVRNGIADALTLVSTAEAGNSRKTIEAVVRKGGFPENPAPHLLGRLTASIMANASDLLAGPVFIANYGWPENYRVLVVDGDCTLETGTGYGLLLVRGRLRYSGSFRWMGLLLVIGEGAIEREQNASGDIYGDLFVARTTDAEPVSADLSGIQVHDDPPERTRANASFPYAIVSVREY